MNTPTIDQLKRGLEIAERIAALETEMAAIFQGHSIASLPPTKNAAAAPKKSKISAEGLARIIAAQKKRWSKVASVKNAQPKKPQAPEAPEKKKSGITAAGRAKLAASMKARWQARKASASPAPAQEQATPVVALDLTPTPQPSTEATPASTPVIEELAVV